MIQFLSVAAFVAVMILAAFALVIGLWLVDAIGEERPVTAFAVGIVGASLLIAGVVMLGMVML